MFFILQQETIFEGEVTNLAEQVKKECNGRYSSDNPLKVTILGYKWDSWCFDSAFLTRKLVIHLAKFPEVKVQFLVPEKSCSEWHPCIKKEAASRYGVTIVEAREQPGFDDPTDWLYFPPQDFTTDIVVGAGERLGKIAQVFKKHHLCKNVYVVSDPYEELSLMSEKLRNLKTKIEKFPIHKRDNIHGLSRMADLAVAPGAKMEDELSASLSYHKKNVLKLTPGVLDEFSDVEQATAERANFRILMFGGGDPNYFEQEGLKTAAKAVAELNDKSYHLLYVGAAKGKHIKKFVEEFRQCGISKSQLTIRSPPESEEKLKSLFCESDLAIMPSSELGFGMMGLAALSSGLPVLVHEHSGFGKALQKVLYGTPSTVDSEDANVWAKAIKRVRNTGRKTRLEAAAFLRSCYDEKYSWEKQCGDLVQKMLTMVTGMNFFDAFYHF